MPEEQEKFNPTPDKQFAPLSRSVEGEEEPKVRLDPDPIFESAGIGVAELDTLIESDERLGGLFLSTIDKLAGAEYAIRQPEECPDNVYEDGKAMIDDTDLESMIEDIIRGAFIGTAFLEISWNKAEKWTPVKITGKPAEWFIFYGDDNEPRFLSKEESENGEPLPTKQFIMVQHRATYKNPYGMKLAGLCYYSATQKREIDRLFLKFIDKYAMEQLVAKVPPTTVKEDRETLLSLLAQMRQDSVIVVDDTNMIEPLGSGNKSQSQNIFRGEINARDKAMTIVVNGSHLNVDQGDGNTGSRALGETHERSEENRTKAYKKMIAKAANTLLRYYTDVNFGEDVVAPEFYFEEPEDIQGERAERDTKLNQQGVKMKSEYYERAYNLEKDEFELSEVGQVTEEIVKGEPNQEPEKPEPEEEKNQFAEFGEFMSEEFIKRLSEAAELKAQDALEAMIQPLVKDLKKAKSYEDAEKILATAYPDLDTDNFEDLMARALTASGVQGMKSA